MNLEKYHDDLTIEEHYRELAHTTMTIVNIITTYIGDAVLTYQFKRDQECFDKVKKEILTQTFGFTIGNKECNIETHQAMMSLINQYMNLLFPHPDGYNLPCTRSLRLGEDHAE